MKDLINKINKILFNLIIEKDVLGFFGSKFEIKEAIIEDSLAYTDYNKIYISSKLIKPISNLTKFIYLHELLHNFLQHKSRRQDREPMTWNIATDFEINELLQNHYNINLHNNNMGFITYKGLKEILPDLTKDMIAEQVYELLKKSQENNNSSSSNNDTQNKQNDSNNGFKEIKINGKKFKVIKSKSNKNENDKNESKSNKEIYKLAEEAMTQAKLAGSKSINIYEKVLKRSSISSKILKKIKEILTSIDSDIGYNRSRRSYTKRNKIFHKFPGVIETKKIINKLYLVVDESGSMTDEELSKVIYGVYDIVSRHLINIKKVTLIRHDIDILVDENLQNFREYKRKKSGGTSHSKVYEWLVNAKKKEDDICIFITDGYSDISELDWSKIHNKKIWIITEEENKEQVEKISHIGSVIDA